MMPMKAHLCWLTLAAVAGTASAQELPVDRVIDDVGCKDDASQHYALYVPSN